MRYISAAEAAERWGLSRRRVITLCNDGRIQGSQKVGATWIIPETAQKPADARVKSGRYIKKCEEKTNGSPD
ncbi:MAG: helix-turn-helix domain-containing protein [Lachnospiraceae bacterium]|nr:helix-turn-helix domain-containing protein [Lachnospiraceae bacterium]